MVCMVLTLLAWLFFLLGAFFILNAVITTSGHSNGSVEEMMKTFFSGIFVLWGFGSWITSVLFWAASAVIQYLSDIRTLLEESRGEYSAR
jgi:hypothetical protein